MFCSAIVIESCPAPLLPPAVASMQPTTIDALPDAVLVSIFECIELVHR